MAARVQLEQMRAGRPALPAGAVEQVPGTVTGTGQYL
jgi:hypothetical protein